MRDTEISTSLDDAYLPMTEKQFLFVVSNMRRKFEPATIAAAKQCLVEPGRLTQKEVSAATGINAGQLSEVLRKIYERRDELISENRLVIVEAWVPVEFELGIRQQEAFVIDKLIGETTSPKTSSTKKKMSATKRPKAKS